MLVGVLRVALCCASVSTALWTPTGLLVGSSVARAAAALGEGVLVDAAVQQLAPRRQRSPPPAGLPIATARWSERRRGAPGRRKTDGLRALAFGAAAAAGTGWADVEPTIPGVLVAALAWDAAMCEAGGLREWAAQITELEQQVAEAKVKIAQIDEDVERFLVAEGREGSAV